MSERDRGAVPDVAMDVISVGFGLQLVGHREHHQIAPRCRVGNVPDVEAFGACLLRRARPFSQGDAKVFCSRITEIQGMGMPL